MQGIHNYTPEAMYSSGQVSQFKQKTKVLHAKSVPFKLMPQSEIDRLWRLKLDEVNFKYKERTKDIHEENARIIEDRRKRIRQYIEKTKAGFKNSIAGIKDKMRLEREFVNIKTFELNCVNILYVIKTWVFSIIGEIKKNAEIARGRLAKEKLSIETLLQMEICDSRNQHLMIEHVNDIVQRINFIVSLNKVQRPSSSFKGSKNKNNKDSISKANIHFEEGINWKSSLTNEITDEAILNKIK